MSIVSEGGFIVWRNLFYQIVLMEGSFFQITKDVVQLLVRCLPLRDQLSCRLVSRTWKRGADLAVTALGIKRDVTAEQATVLLSQMTNIVSIS